MGMAENIALKLNRQILLFTKRICLKIGILNQRIRIGYLSVANIYRSAGPGKLGGSLIVRSGGY